MADPLDIAANRAARKWTTVELIARTGWELLSGPLFGWTPRQFWGWRRFVLRAFGAQIGHDAHIFPSVRIAIPWNLSVGEQAAIGERAIIYSLGKISIGARATISQYAHLCGGTHDHSRADFPLLKLPVTIGEGAWICADAFVGPGVIIGDYAIVAARAVVTKPVDPWTIVAGNPASTIRKRLILGGGMLN